MINVVCLSAKMLTFSTCTLAGFICEQVPISFHLETKSDKRFAKGETFALQVIRLIIGVKVKWIVLDTWNAFLTSQLKVG